MTLVVPMVGCSSPSGPAERTAAPNSTSATRGEPGGRGPYAVASAHPLATDAGMAVLARGGSAVDAAVAVQAVLGLVEPQSSGLGGGAFLMHYDSETGAVTAYDGREEAPAGATTDMFLGEDSQPLSFPEASRSGTAVGTPGVVAMLALAHEAHGHLAWRDLFEQAITLADRGFEVSPRMADAVAAATGLGAGDDFTTLFARPDGQPLQAGDKFTNPAYARSLRAIADDWQAMYRGMLASAVVDAANRAPRPGRLTAADVAAYRARRVEPVCTPFAEHRVCGPPPPSSGGIGVGSLLGQLDHLDRASAGPTLQGWHLFAEASRRAYADRDRYVGDDRYVAVPTDAMVDPAYLAERAATIDPDRASEKVEAGVFAGYPRAVDRSSGDGGTSHFNVVDAEGDVVAMTTSVETLFGSRRVVGGFVLNNTLTDFDRSPPPGTVTVANAIGPRRRPRSSMSPTLVLNSDGRFQMAVGSPGGNAIIAYVAKTLMGMLAWHMTPAEAVALPNLVARGDSVALEVEAAADSESGLEADLVARGHNVQPLTLEISGIQVIALGPDNRLIGAADRRREGTFDWEPGR